jgi:tetratricopeptide (TPR) repeat protein
MRRLSFLVTLGLLVGAPQAAPAKAHGPTVAEALDLLEAWQLEDAKAMAEQLFVADPKSAEVWYLAGRVQHARGEHLAAVSLLEAARDGGVVDAGYALPLAESSGRYQAHFQSVTTAHFVVRYLDKDEITASYAAPVLEAAYQAIGTALGLLPAERGEKIVVEIYPDARGLAGATGLTIKEIETSGTIAVCKFHRMMVTSPLATSDGYDWADTIAHELTHLIISKKSKNTIPIWLHEGIAKYFESAWRGKPGTGLSAYAEKLLADAVRKKKFITYQQMHPSMAKLPSQEDASLAFAEVFTTIEYLVQEHGGASIPKVLEASAAGLELDAALRSVYGMGLLGVESSWKRYLLHRPFREVPGAKPHPIRLAADEKEASAARPLEAMQDKEVHDLSRLGELLQLRGHTQAAVVEYEKAYRKSGPTYATLVYRLARAYLDARRDAEAVAILDKALSIHPEDGDLRILAGRAHLVRKDDKGALANFEAARLQNPFNPEIHDALRQLYEHRGDVAGAAREAHFLELSRKPRPTRTYERPAARPGTAKLDLVAVPFGEVRLDGTALAAPVWGVPVEPGKHELVFTLASGEVKREAVEVASGDRKLVVLR